MSTAAEFSPTSGQEQADLFQGMSPKEIADNLDALAHRVTEESYMRPLTDEELDTRKNHLVDNAVELNLIAEEKKAVTAELNGRATRLTKLNKGLLDDITHKAVKAMGTVYEILDDTKRWVDKYNENGVWLERRRANSDDAQGHINHMRLN